MPTKPKHKPGIHLLNPEPIMMDGYLIYPDGRVLGKKGGFLKLGISGSGYYNLNMHNNGIQKSYILHRIIAKLFVPNPLNLPEVNHIDGNKLNNNYTNLEWVTRSENIRHRHSTGITKPTWKGKFGKDHNASKTVTQIDKSGILVATFGSAEEAMRLTGIKGIRNALTGRRKYAGGFSWRYISPKNNNHP